MTDTLRIKAKNVGEVKRTSTSETKAMKAFDEYASDPLRVLGVPFGGPYKGRDSDGETFHEDTDIWLKEGDTIPVTYYHGFGPDDPQEWQERPVMIGRAKYAGKDERGHWFDMRLDSEEELAKRIIEDPLKSRASSGAVSHLVRMGDAGMIDVWPVGELAVFDTNEWRQPANDFAVIEGVKSAEVEAKAEMQSDTDETKSPEIIEPTIKQEIVKMDENEKNTEEKGVDVDALVAKFSEVVDEKIKAAWNAEATTVKAVAVVKAENLGDPDPNKAFMHYIKTGEHVKGLKAAMGEGTAGVGGYLVPDDFYNGIIEKRNEMSIPRRAGAMIIQTSRDVINVPTEATSQTYFAQASHDMAALDEDEPTVGSVAINIYPFTKLVKVSEDLLDDNAANLNQFLTNSFGRWAAMTENRNVLIGAGTTAPQGVTVGGTAALTFDDTNSIAAAEIPELYYKLAQPYRDNAVWTLNDDTIAMLRGLSSSSVFTFGAHEIDENRMMGKPYYTSTYMAKYTTTAYKSIVFGDWGLYAMGERKGMTIKRLNELYAGNRQVGLVATMRFGGAVLQAEAFAVAKQA